MTQGVLDLIQAIESGDSVSIDAAFNAEMAMRISDKLDDMRADVAKNVFTEACGSYKKKMKEEECDDEEDEDEEDEKVKVTKEELEELEAYMQSEEFEQLDELSKSTLGSYVKKAGQHRVRLAGTEKELDDKDSAIQKAKRGMDNASHSAMSTAQDAVRKQRNAVSDKSMNRAQGIHTAIKKLTK